MISNDKKIIIIMSLVECMQKKNQHEWTLKETRYWQVKWIKFIFEVLQNLLSETFLFETSSSETSLLTVSKLLLFIVSKLHHQSSYQYETLLKQHQKQSQFWFEILITQALKIASTTSQAQSHERELASNHEKELVNLNKLYKDELKYSDMNESLSQKMIIFYDICN